MVILIHFKGQTICKMYRYRLIRNILVFKCLLNFNSFMFMVKILSLITHTAFHIVSCTYNFNYACELFDEHQRLQHTARNHWLWRKQSVIRCQLYSPPRFALRLKAMTGLTGFILFSNAFFSVRRLLSEEGGMHFPCRQQRSVRCAASDRLGLDNCKIAFALSVSGFCQEMQRSAPGTGHDASAQCQDH